MVNHKAPPQYYQYFFAPEFCLEFVVCPVKYFFCIVHLTGKLHVVAPHHMVSCMLPIGYDFFILDMLAVQYLFVNGHYEMMLIDECVFF